jgi:hypothetical protein
MTKIQNNKLGDPENAIKGGRTVIPAETGIQWFTIKLDESLRMGSGIRA